MSHSKGSVSPSLAGCGASVSRCFEKCSAFHRLWNVGLLDGILPVQVIWMSLLYVLKCISGCGLSFPCPNPIQLVRLGSLLCEHLSAGCLRKLKCQIDLLRFFFSQGRKVSIQFMPWINPKGCIFLHQLNKRSLNLTNVSQPACTFTECSAINMTCAYDNINNLLLKSRTDHIPLLFIFKLPKKYIHTFLICLLKQEADE